MAYNNAGLDPDGRYARLGLSQSEMLWYNWDQRMWEALKAGNFELGDEFAEALLLEPRVPLLLKARAHTAFASDVGTGTALLHARDAVRILEELSADGTHYEKDLVRARTLLSQCESELQDTPVQGADDKQVGFDSERTTSEPAVVTAEGQIIGADLLVPQSSPRPSTPVTPSQRMHLSSSPLHQQELPFRSTPGTSQALESSPLSNKPSSSPSTRPRGPGLRHPTGNIAEAGRGGQRDRR